MKTRIIIFGLNFSFLFFVQLFLQNPYAYTQEQYLAKVLKGHSKGVKVIEFETEGQNIVSASQKEINIWSMQGSLIKQKVFTTTAPLTELVDVTFLRGKVFFSWMFDVENGGVDGVFSSWEVSSDRIQTLFQDQVNLLGRHGLWNVNAVASNTAKGIIAVSLTYSTQVFGKIVGSIRIFDSRNGKEINRIDAYPHIRAMQFDSYGDRLAIASEDKTVGILHIDSKSFIWQRTSHAKAVTSVSFSKDEKYLVTGSDDKTIILWDALNGSPIRSFSDHIDDVRSVALSPDGSFLASGSKDKTVRLWTLNTGEKIITINAHEKGVNAVAFSPDGLFLASGSDDETIKVWDFKRIKADYETKQQRIAEKKTKEELRIAAEKAEEERRRNAMPADLRLTVNFSDNRSLIPNSTLDAGEFAELLITVNNMGEGLGFEVTLSLTVESSFVRLTPTKVLGEIAPGDSKRVPLPITADIDAPDGMVAVLIQAKEKRGYDARPVKLQIPVRHLDKPILAIASCKINDGKTGLAKGNDNSIPENEEIIELDVIVKNDGVGVALNTKLTLASINTGINVLRKNVFLGDIVPNQTKGGKLAFKIPRVYQAEQLKFELEVTDTLAASHIRRAYSVAIGRSMPVLAYDFRILNSLGKQVTQITNGEEFVLEISPKNEGNNTATQVELRVITPSSVQLDREIVTIGRLEAGIVGAPAQVRLRVPRSFRASQLTLGLQLTQSDFPKLSDQQMIPVHLRRPLLTVADHLNTSDGDVFIKQRETVELHLQVRNDGDLAAEDVRVALQLDKSGIDFHEGEKLLGTVPPSNSISTKFSFHVKGSAARGPLSVVVKIRQADGFDGVENKLDYQILKEDTLVLQVKGKETEQVPRFVSPKPTNEQPDIAKQPKVSSTLSDWFAAPINQHFSTIKDVTIDGEPIPSLKIEQVGKEIRFRGADELKDKLRRGSHKISMWLDGIKQEFYFWKGLEELQYYQKESFGNNYALIIGISNYGKGLSNLPEVGAQVRELGKLLEASDFKVTYLLDTERKVTRQAVDVAISELNKKLNVQKDRLFFYYGGHGKADKPAFGGSLAYLILNEYDMDDLESTCLSMDDICSKYVKQIKAKHILFAIDACFASIGFRLIKPDQESIRQFMDLNLIYSLTRDSGRTIFTAGKGAQEAIDEPGKGGIFTTALINALKGDADLHYGDGNGVTIMNELETYLHTRITSEARLKNRLQEPERYDYGEGQFVFFHNPIGRGTKPTMEKR